MTAKRPKSERLSTGEIWEEPSGRSPPEQTAALPLPPRWRPEGRAPQEPARSAQARCAPLIGLGLADYFLFAFRFFFFAAFFFDVLRAAFFAAILRTVVAFFLLFGIETTPSRV